MKDHYEGIGQWAATFACDGVKEGQVVKISGGGSVSPCGGGDSFCGVALSVGRDEKACAVALGGLVTTSYTGAAPALGWTGLAADGSGGVKTAEGGRSRLVVDVDESGSAVAFML